MYIVIENDKLIGFLSKDVNNEQLTEKESSTIKEIDDELWFSLLIGEYSINKDILDSTEGVLTLKDKEKIFIEIEPKIENIKDQGQLLTEELSKVKVALIQQQNINKTILEQAAKDKLSAMEQQELNKKLLGEIATIKINNMKGGN